MSQPDGSKPSIEELLARARAGERGALDELLRRSQARLATWASPQAPGGNRPSDIVQVSLERAFKKFNTFMGTTEGEWFAWLKRVLRSQSTQLAREALSQKRDDSGNLSLDTEEAEGTPAPEHSPSQVSAHQEQWRQLLTHFFYLPEDQREALSLFHLREFSMAEVARRMGRSTEAVDSLMQRGLRALRRQMAGGTGAADEDPRESAAARNAADAALLAYFRRREAGEVPDPEAFAAEYPNCTEELRSMLHWLEQLRALRPPEEP